MEGRRNARRAASGSTPAETDASGRAWRGLLGPMAGKGLSWAVSFRKAAPAPRARVAEPARAARQPGATVTLW
eukprot:12416546-Alexandrium_andersonii.AAC.1